MKAKTKNVLCLMGGEHVSACGIHFLPGRKFLLELVTKKEIDPVGRLQLDFATVRVDGVFTHARPQIECSYDSHASLLDASLAQIQSIGSGGYFWERLNKILAQFGLLSLTAGEFSDFTWTATAKDEKHSSCYANSTDFADVIFRLFDQLVERGDVRPILRVKTANELLDECRKIASCGWPFESLPSMP